MVIGRGEALSSPGMVKEGAVGCPAPVAMRCEPMFSASVLHRGDLDSDGRFGTMECSPWQAARWIGFIRLLVSLNMVDGMYGECHGMSRNLRDVLPN